MMTVELVKALAWPALFLVVVLLFRPTLAQAVDRLRVVRSPYFEGRFDRGASTRPRRRR